ncbi:MAG TPA: endolytic transglycosylase MltG [Fimbriimonas sp.]
MKKLRASLSVLLLLLLLAAGGLYLWIQSGLGPGTNGSEVLVRYERETPLATILKDLEKRGVVHNPEALLAFAKLRKYSTTPVSVGTYRFRAFITGKDVLKALRDPVRQMVRLPETNWAARSANILEENGVCSASEYLALVRKPDEFRKEVSFPLPKDSLEGYLYPDTYDLPPLLGARQTILRQLKTFEKKAWNELGKPKNLHRLVTVASMVQMEVAKDEERAKVAGVIQNRLNRNMRLQIDATINYALQKWRPLTLADYREVESPYNTYLVDGLPPGPICSPSFKSIEAALKPSEHRYLYYVANPQTNEHMFAPTYQEHLRNVARRKRIAKGMGS